LLFLHTTTKYFSNLN
jgi:hypothetical protein